VAVRAWVVDDPMVCAVNTGWVTVHFTELPLITVRLQGVVAYVPVPPVPVVERATVPVGTLAVPVSVSVTVTVHVVVAVRMWIVVGVHEFVVVVVRNPTVMVCPVDGPLAEWALSPA